MISGFSTWMTTTKNLTASNCHGETLNIHPDRKTKNSKCLSFHPRVPLDAIKTFSLIQGMIISILLTYCYYFNIHNTSKCNITIWIIHCFEKDDLYCPRAWKINFGPSPQDGKLHNYKNMTELFMVTDIHTLAFAPWHWRMRFEHVKICI